MPEIIGPFKVSSTTFPPLDAHVTHLRHLTNTQVAADLLRHRFKFGLRDARETAKLLGAHVAQSLEFYDQSRIASAGVRPLLQYYCYLNLSVATILAYRPENFNGYRRHGVEDCTHALSSLEISSQVVKVNRGAVPLFHSIISDTSLEKRKFSLIQLAAGFPMVEHELRTYFKKKTLAVYVQDRLVKGSEVWHSEFEYETLGNEPRITIKRLEEAMPLLASDYQRQPKKSIRHIYRSKSSWAAKSEAQRVHRENGLKLINFGGHQSFERSDREGGSGLYYAWRGVSRIALLPTLSSILLMSFSLSSISRYRPVLLQKAMASPIQVLLDTFVQEADGVFIPALRNLLYREEVVIGPTDFV